MPKPHTIDTAHAAALRSQGMQWRDIARALGCNHNTLRRVMRGHNRAQKSSHTEVSRKGDDVRVVSAPHAATVEHVAAESGLSLDEWRCVRVEGKPYQGFMKAADGGATVVNLWSRSFTFERIPDVLRLSLSACPVYGEPAAPPSADADACALIIPDSQNGYRRDTRGRLEPLHDRRAWDLAVQAAAVVQPDTVVLLGDMLDLAPWSTKWPTPLALRDTTNPARAELRWWIQQLREAAPSARIVWLEGNHEHRISRLLTERAAELGGLEDLETGGPLITVPRIMQMDGLRVEYVEPYGTPWWLWRETPGAAVMLHHGHKHGARGGQSVAKALIDDPVSSIFGHVHRREVASRCVVDPREPSGSREVYALTPGTIARTDGAVPAASPRVDWQQGLAVIRRVAGVAHPALVPILDGRAVVEGRVLTARDRLPDIKAALPGWRW